MGKPKTQSTTPKRDEGTFHLSLILLHLWIRAADGSLANNLVLSYLRKQNRPYSATDITNNLHNQVSKSTAQKVLQELVEAGGVHCKTQGPHPTTPLTLFRHVPVAEADGQGNRVFM